MTQPLIRSLTFAVVAATLIAACADNTDGFEPGAPIPTDDTRPPVTSTTSTTTTETAPTTDPSPSTSTNAPTPPTTETVETSTTTTVTTPETTNPTSTTEAEPELEKAPQAPGFDFPAADLQTDPDSPNNNRAIRPEDEPVIDAYLAAFEAELATFSRWPLNPRSPALLAAPFTGRVYPLYEAGMTERTQLNQVLDITGGLTSRPYVIDDDDGDPDRAVVWDCQIDATFWKDVDTGEKAPPDAYLNVGPPGAEQGSVSVLLRVDGEWLVDQGAVEARACS